MRTRRIMAVLAMALAITGVGLASGSSAGAESDESWDYAPLSVSGQYKPFVGDFVGDFSSDIVWYAPGTGTDTIYVGTENDRTFTKIHFAMDDDAVPVVGDFGGDEHDDILWYRPGPGADHLWIATGDESVFDTSRTVTLNGDYRPVVLHDYRSGKQDRVFWYRPGDGTDPLWIFHADATHTVVTEQIRNDLQVIAGDWTGDGVEDLLLYGPGSLPDRIWTSHSSHFTSRSVTVNGRYQVATIVEPQYDDVLFFGTGDKPDVIWHNSASGFHSSSIYVPARGKPMTAGIGAAIVYSPVDRDDLVLSDGTNAAAFYLSDTHDMGPGKTLLVGNFENDDYFDLLWYGPGTASDALWYGHNADLAGTSVPASPVRGAKAARGAAAPDRLPIS
ncbi:MAG: hypothetical protein JO291_11555 [Acidimicrobiia bacterium]|nr:hypothetical protein [Acidimicrobiia bacterium]